MRLGMLFGCLEGAKGEAFVGYGWDWWWIDEE